MAMSANGYIADKNGGEDFLSDDNWEEFSSFVKEFGNFVIGRKSYEAVQAWGTQYGLDDFSDVTEKVILSRNSSYPILSGYTLKSSPQEALDFLKKQGIKDALITGGTSTNLAFIQNNLIDELVLNVEPVLVGEGMPVFGIDAFEKRLQLRNVKTLTNDIIQLRYTLLT